MSRRLVSLALIAAVIACPWGCIPAVCPAAAGWEDRAAAVTQATAPSPCGCCGEPPLAGPRGDDSDPGDAPRDSSYQGICGGALFAKPLQGDIQPEDSPLPGADHLRWAASPRAPTPALDGGNLAARGANPGRLLRTRYLSFLC